MTATLAYLGKYEESIKYFDMALEIDPDNKDTQKYKEITKYRLIQKLIITNLVYIIPTIIAIGVGIIFIAKKKPFRKNKK